ncbi:wdr5, partial [Symbiodinium sp. KB8]
TMVHVENTGASQVELAKGTAFLSGSTFITHVAVSEDGKRVAGAAGDSIVVFNRDGESGRLQEVVRFPADFATSDTPDVNALAWGWEHTCLVSGGADGVVRVWHVGGEVDGPADCPRLVAECTGHSAPVVSLAVNVIGGLVASGSMDGTCRIWSLPQLRGAVEGDVFSWTLPCQASAHITKPAPPRAGRKQRHTTPGSFKYVSLHFLEDTLLTLETSQFGGALASLWTLTEAPQSTFPSTFGPRGVDNEITIMHKPVQGASRADADGVLTPLPAPASTAEETQPALSRVLGEWAWHADVSKVVTPRAAATSTVTRGGGAVAIACADRRVYEYALPDLAYVGAYQTTHSFGALGLAYTPDGAHLLTASADHSILLWSRVRRSNLALWGIALLLALFIAAVAWQGVQLAHSQEGAGLPGPFHLASAAVERLVRVVASVLGGSPVQPLTPA